MRTRRDLAAGATLALFLAMPGDVRAIDAATVLAALAFPADTWTRVERGGFVNVPLPASSDRDVNVGIAFLVARHSPRELARTVRAEKRPVHADASVVAYGDFAGDGTTADLAGLRLTPAQAAAFARAAPGTDLNLSLDEIDALHAARGDAVAVENAVHALLLARHRAYRAKGLAAVAPYARHGYTTSPSHELAAANRAARTARVLPTTLYDLLDRYPDARLRDFAEDLYWLQFRANGEDTIALEHAFDATIDGTTVLVQRQYYVSTGYNAEQAIVGLFPFGDGTLVVYTNHTSTDRLVGPGAVAKRAIGRRLMADQLERVFAKTRADLEAVPADRPS